MKAFHTVRYLRPRQVINRISRRFVALPPPPDGACHRLIRGRRAVPGIAVDRQHQGGRRFTFLNRTVDCSGGDRWLPQGTSALWRYQLHYFRYLTALAPPEAVSLLDDWLVRNPPGSPVAWDPYPISLRLREWLEWLVGHPETEPAFEQRLVASIAHQTEVLERKLEYHLMANHLLENAITLCWMGLGLEGPLASRWAARGRELLRRELAEQLLADGTHFERSPMYQAAISESLLRLAEVAEASSSAAARSIAALARPAGERLVASLAPLSHPDGEIALVNDSAFGQAPTLAQLERRFGRPPPIDGRSPAAGLWRLPRAGYSGWREQQSGRYLIFDAGELGPDYNPGHGHADVLSFEVSHRGRRLITDTGVFAYAEGPVRAYDRSTAAHNTIEVDGSSQSEPWGAFRWGRRARILAAGAEGGPRAGARLHGSYRGPLPRARRVEHARSIGIDGRSLSFSDSVRASGGHTAVLRLHLGPELAVRGGDGAVLVADESGARLARIALTGGDWTPGVSPYHPEFGLEVERSKLEATFGFRDRLACEWSIELL